MLFLRDVDCQPPTEIQLQILLIDAEIEQHKQQNNSLQGKISERFKRMETRNLKRLESEAKQTIELLQKLQDRDKDLEPFETFN